MLFVCASTQTAYSVAADRIQSPATFLHPSFTLKFGILLFFLKELLYLEKSFTHFLCVLLAKSSIPGSLISMMLKVSGVDAVMW